MTLYDPQQVGWNRLFATAMPKFFERPGNSGFPAQKLPQNGRFVVRDIFVDFRRHDLGPTFHERNFDGSTQRLFMTEPLWGRSFLSARVDSTTSCSSSCWTAAATGPLSAEERLPQEQP